MLVGQERERTLAVELHEGSDTGRILGACILGGRASERSRGVSFDVDNVCSRAIIRNERELLLNSGFLEEGSCLAVRSRECVSAVGRGIGLRL